MKALLTIKLAGWSNSWGKPLGFEFLSVKVVALGFGLELSLGMMKK